jgi:hypothetical protein
MATDPDEKMLLLFSIAKGDKRGTGVVYSIWHGDTSLDTLTPPYQVLACDEASGYTVVVQDAVQFVRQFGPYELPED